MTGRESETGDLFFRALGIMKCRENMKVTIRPINPIKILL